MSRKSAKNAKNTPMADLHPELAWVGQGIHGEERREGVRILARSIMTGDFNDMYTEATQEFRALRRDFQAAGTWETVEELFRDYQERNRAAANQGFSAGMSHGCKRLRDVESDDDESWLGLNDITGNSPRNGPPPPQPVNGPVPAADASLRFPEGIANMAQWGDTVIKFGKYKDKDLPYMDLANDLTKEALSYKKWLIGHQVTATGQCKDVASYLKRRQLANDLPMLCAGTPVIPGTSETRSFKSGSSTRS
ncbi:GIP [Symbiodinium sp. CCMP2456]|nr:GIP [Symbiodinium sp. CCMP2456]